MSSPLLEVSNLTKYYGQYKAVDGISFTLEKGQILGLLGPNGAGKTTTIQMLLGLTTPDGGNIRYFGKDFSQHRSRILARVNFASTYSEMQARITIKQSLTVYAGLYGITNPQAKIDSLLELLEIPHLANKTYWKLSSGQKTRAVLARSLLNDPEILLMDEPTASLDPEIVNKVIELIRRLQKERDIGILFTSHNMEEVSRLCDEVMFLQEGKIVAQDTPVQLTKLVGNAKLLVTFDAERKKVRKYLETLEHSFHFSKNKQVEIDLPEEKIASVLFAFKKHDIFVHNIAIKKPTLEDVFLHIAGSQRNKINE